MGNNRKEFDKILACRYIGRSEISYATHQFLNSYRVKPSKDLGSFDNRAAEQKI